MKEIKFRAWDKKKQEMVYVLEMKFLFESATGIWIMGYDDDKIDHEIFPEHLELMQYIDLKDKNGKEVYGGDLLKCDQWPRHVIVQVKWNDDEWRWAMESNDPKQFYWEDFSSWIFKKNMLTNFHITGNIWENPELLAVEREGE